MTAGADSGGASTADVSTAAAASSIGNGAGSSPAHSSVTAQADGAAADSPSRQQSYGAASTSGAAATAAAETPPAGSSTPVRDSIRRKLTEALTPVRLEIHDDSAQHAGHAGSRMQAGYSGETHFRVDVTSSAFQGLKTLKQHRLVYDVRLLIAPGVLQVAMLEREHRLDRIRLCPLRRHGCVLAPVDLVD